MRKFILLLLVLSGSAASSQNYWLPLDSIKGPGKSVASTFVLNGEGYIMCGLETNGFTRRMYSYDIGQNDWDSAQSVGGINGSGLSRGSACAFSINNKGYVCLGQGDNTNFLNDLWEYDPVQDVWTQKANYAGSARRAAVSFVIGNYAYVGTGQDVNGLRKDFFRYNPATNVWDSITPFGGTPRKYAVGFAMGNQGYVGTGDDGTLRNDFWQYQVATNSWIQKANFPGAARAGATGWGNFPNGYIATGEDLNWNYCNDVWEYNYFTNAWVVRAPLPSSGRKHAISFMIGNVAYVGAGYNGIYLDDFYSYTGFVGIQENELTVSPMVYPNPSYGSFTVTLPDYDLRECTVQMTDVNGKVVSEQFATEAHEESIRVSSLHARSGTFHVTVITREGAVVGTTPILLQH